MNKHPWYCFKIDRILKPALFVFLFIVYASGRAGAQVDDEELKKGQERIVFINYEGPHARIETLGQIKAIGTGLGSALSDGAARSGGGNRYFVIHSVSGPDGNKIDADIFGLGVDVGVDHIRNLRLIIQGYLESAYAYSARDAALLAEYVTIYNAVFRGNWEYFTTRYKNPVVSNLSSDKAGLSIRFDEWPGRTLMVIPLASGRPGSLSAVDTGSLSSPEVVEEMRREEDRGIESRRDMVDLKEREAEEAEEEAAYQREAIQEEERRIQEEQEAIQQEREAIAQERQEQGGQQTPAQAEELARREEEATRREEALSQQQEQLEEQRSEAERLEEFAGEKAAEAQEDRQEIARDQQELIAQEDARAGAAASMLAVRFTGPDTSLGDLVRVNAATGEELRASTLHTISGRTVTLKDGRIFAVAGENRGPGAVRLIELSPDTLEMKAQGTDDIHPLSLLWVNGDNLYAISVVADKLYLSRFNTSLERQARSSATVHAQAALLFDGTMLLTQRDDGSVLILNANDLTEAKR
ncbi:MAG: hypothetical protein LBK40_07415 [Spirochaetaceae bacterium]|jgi:hypothetical protein|nr:hypothetical protein [Spirochaetaceae bacterium]